MSFIQDLAVVMVVAGAVGWFCQRLGLSLVVGYLLAGAVIGPFTPPFQLVDDLERVHMLSQVGLVFLIFSIGLGLSFQRLRRLGFSVVLGTVIGAILVFHGCRALGGVVGWNQAQSLFVAAMLMVSSSAIIGKVLEELNATHSRPGQLALGVTVLEDMVAVVMLTLLSSLIQFGGGASPPLAQTIGALSSFIIFLLLVSLLLVPRLLLRLTESGAAEVRTLIVIGLLLSLSWLAARAGYSLALGAFLLGVIVASTPHQPEIERVCAGIRDMFGAVFFVSMGMLVDFHLLADAWPLVLLLTAAAIVLRTIATTLGLVLTGNSINESLRAGLALTPLGEFSFIIAQTGVTAKVIPETFFPMAIGASLFTALLAPLLMRRGPAISNAVDERLPLFLREWISFYHGWLEQIGRRQQRSVVWRLTAPRLAQTAMQILFVSALLLFANPIYEHLAARLGANWPFPGGLKLLFWSGFTLFLLAPLVAIWRNFEALAMILAESATQGASRRRALRPLITTALKTVASTVLAFWLMALLPFGFSAFWVFLVVLAIAGALAAVFWRRLVYWHSRVEIELRTQLQSALGPASPNDLAHALRERQDEWKLQAEEFVLPDFAACAGKRISELALRKRFGCSIASIDRQGFLIMNPAADIHLYPRDKLLLIGSAEQIDLGARELGVTKVDREEHDLEELTLDIVLVPHDCPKAGQPLAGLDLIRQVGVQLAGIQRGGRRMLNPAGTDCIEAGDELLVLGTPKQIQDFREWLNPPVSPLAE
ncbi:MAG: cation:proton antiporter [Verrucomicrobiota bacterium]